MNFATLEVDIQVGTLFLSLSYLKIGCGIWVGEETR